MTPVGLSSPGQIKPFVGTAKTRRWIVADADHHQLVLFLDNGEAFIRFGSGESGCVDGPIHEACFNAPSGFASSSTHLYVADPENHAIRLVDLEAGEVLTFDVGPASPWDLALWGDRLFFSDGVSGSLGEIDLRNWQVRILAGIRENRIGRRAQLAFDPARTFVYGVDDMDAVLRRFHLDGSLRVETMVAEGVLRQPRGVCVGDGVVFVGDEGGVRVFDVDGGGVVDLDGGDFVCLDAAPLPLGGLGGLALDGPGRLLVSDTANHRIMEYDLAGRRYRSWA